MNPRYSLHTTDKTSPRSFPWIWFLRLAQFFISLLVLAVTAAAIALLVGPSDGGCSVPGKMGWNLACVGSTSPYLLGNLLTSNLGRSGAHFTRLLDSLIRHNEELQSLSMVDLHPTRFRCIDVHLLDCCCGNLPLWLRRPL